MYTQFHRKPLTQSPRDPRLLHILLMLALLSGGAYFRDFSLSLPQTALAYLAGLSTQYLLVTTLALPRRGYLSTLISCTAVALLLRSSSLWAHPFAAAAAVSSKYIFRCDGRHFFNPANLGVVAAIALLPDTWISAGQWGSDIAALVLFVAVGSYAVGRIGFQLLSWSFLLWYMGIWWFHRILWLGYEPSVWLHQLSSGSLLLFAFFMISDPRTAPQHWFAKVLQTAFVAALAYVWQYFYYYNNALLWALAAAAPLVPLWNRLLPAVEFDWKCNPVHTGEKQENEEPHNEALPMDRKLAR